jgi:hypothetical protein
MTRPLSFYLLLAVVLAWAALEGFWAYQDSHRIPDPCGQYFQEDATQ